MPEFFSPDGFHLRILVVTIVKCRFYLLCCCSILVILVSVITQIQLFAVVKQVNMFLPMNMFDVGATNGVGRDRRQTF